MKTSLSQRLHEHVPSLHHEMGREPRPMVPQAGNSPHQMIANNSPQVRQLKTMQASANAQPVVQRLVALVSDKLEAEKGKRADQVQSYDPAVLVGGFEAKKWTGGPIKLLKSIEAEDAKGLEAISIVGHGTASQTTGGLDIDEVVNHLADAGFGKPTANAAKRTAHVNLFSCISGSEAENTPGADASLYKAAFDVKGINATVLAPKGIAMPKMSHQAGIKMTSITMEETAVYRALDTYQKIKSHWTVVGKNLPQTKSLDDFMGELNDADAKWDEEKVTAFNKSLVGHQQATWKNNPKFAERMKTAKIADEKAASQLPASLLDLVNKSPKSESEQATYDLISSQYKLDLDTFRPKGAPNCDFSASELEESIKTAIGNFKVNWDPGAGKMEVGAQTQIPQGLPGVSGQLGNQANWVIQ